MIELGAGFHPDMSGRENIYINASIFGLTKKEIDRRLADIIAFSELEEFIDNPVRTYSSGMYMRLAFSVAINVDADILLIDEILAVGDVNFQAKCFNRLREIKAQGTTIVIVSHSLGQIEQICDRSIWIHEGVIRAEGKPRDVHPAYLDFMGEKREKTVQKERERIAEKEEQEIKSTKEKEEKEETIQPQLEERSADEIVTEQKRWGNGKARIKEVLMMNAAGKTQTVFKTGEAVKIKIDYSINTIVEDAIFGIGIFRSDGLQCYGTNTRIEQFERFDLKKNGSVVVSMPEMSLLSGEYTLDVAIQSEINTPVDYYREAYKFQVYSPWDEIGVSRMGHKWIFEMV